MLGVNWRITLAATGVAKFGAIVSIAAGLAFLMAAYSTQQLIYFGLCATYIALGAIQYHVALRAK